ncbi:MAG: 50S ribosomal protein L30 [Anaerolineae bacterium UTCFX2]|jgi:large subunit ribosomal protein L30|nr:50S ribosomal protein L30 [Anaerolineales bacterium]OQY87255.1 MAG: 50S ribosomal protein L30 [Anaerolineae bacterium UTCFX2]
MPRTSSSKSNQEQPKRVQITLVKSPIGYSVRHKATVRALGLHRMHQTVEHVDSPTLRGMLAKVNHLVEVVDVTEARK